MNKNIDTENYKQKLDAELKVLEGELRTIGRKNPDNPNDWEAVPADIVPDLADETEVADSIEEYEGNTAILKQLEIRYNDIRKALERIKNGTFGVCEISGDEIERERLDANPAARTSIANKEKENELRTSGK